MKQKRYSLYCYRGHNSNSSSGRNSFIIFKFIRKAVKIKQNFSSVTAKKKISFHDTMRKNKTESSDERFLLDFASSMLHRTNRRHIETEFYNDLCVCGYEMINCRNQCNHQTNNRFLDSPE